ncbi:MAG: hypothetical protein LH469_00655 [Frankiaceae bacterium]|nr:hypothetical protein [Frankiaceae bacterium]
MQLHSSVSAPPCASANRCLAPTGQLHSANAPVGSEERIGGAQLPRRVVERAVPTLRRMSVLSRFLPAAVVLVALLGAAGCGGSSSPSSPAAATAAASAAPDRQQAVPAKFAAACGKPGSRVSAPSSITIKHTDCDLTGVTISSPGQGGAVVPEPGRGVSNSAGLSLSTNADGDVTVSLEQ